MFEGHFTVQTKNLANAQRNLLLHMEAIRFPQDWVKSDSGMSKLLVDSKAMT